MTALPQPPAQLLTVAKYAELGETESGYTELLVQLRPQLPDHLEVIPDIDLQLHRAAHLDQPAAR